MKPNEFRLDGIERERGWQIIELLNEALALSNSKLSDYIEQECSKDPQLKAQIEALVAADRQAGDFLERHVPEWTADGLEEVAAANHSVSSSSGIDLLGIPATRSVSAEGQPVQSIGPYRLLEVLGEGGMGTVYLAEQQYPVQRKIALKVIRHGMYTKQIVARFEAERQALALMDHSCIAKVLDAGTTILGRPYFVMEYVKGIPITSYCDKHRLTLRERLELFVQLCDGVQHAHQKAIIHRDLKPSNVLVTVQGETPAPKIIDFGIAKAMAQKLTEKTMYTALGELIGTPEYMSPEQAEMTGEDVDTRTDVYSLGVILYELLTGALPLDPTELRKAGFEGILRMIRESDPPRPSVKVRTLGDRLTSVAEARRILLGKLASQLRGDLDWISMKSMEKDRTRRYTSAAELAMDLRRYLRHEPVSAGPPSNTYRMRKFVRRHRVGVVAAAIVAVSLVGATITSLRFAWKEAQQRRETERERDTAQAVAEFLTQLFKVNDPFLGSRYGPSQPNVSWGDSVTARQILDRGAVQLTTELRDRPEIHASLLSAVGNTYVNMGLYDRAQPLLEEALKTCEQVFGIESLRTALCMSDLAILFDRRADVSDFIEAERLQMKALLVYRQVLGDKDDQTIEGMTFLGKIQQHRNELEAAEASIREALAIALEAHGNEHPLVVTAMRNLASVLLSKDQLEEAEALFRQVVELSRSIQQPLATQSGHCSDLADVLVARGKYAEAESLYRESLAISRESLGNEHPETAITLQALGNLLQMMGRYDEAEGPMREALRIDLNNYGEDHPNVSTGKNNLAVLLHRKGDYAGAALAFRDILVHDRPVLVESERRRDLAISIGNLAYELYFIGEYDEAETLHREALSVLRNAYGDTNKTTPVYMVGLGLVLSAKGEHEGAREMVQGSLTMRRTLLGDDHPDVATSLDALANVWLHQGSYEKAESTFREALIMRRKLLGDEHPKVAESLVGLSRALVAQNDFFGAESLASRAVSIRRTSLPATHPLISEAESVLGECLTGLHRYPEAEPLLVESYARITDRVGKNHIQSQAALKRIVQLFTAWNQPAKAKEYAKGLRASPGMVP